MGINEAVAVLGLLKDKIQRLTFAETEMEKAVEELREAESRQPTAVADFDRIHKRAYVISRIGEEPVKPAGKIKMAVPVYLAKLKIYQKQLAEYKEKEVKCISAYLVEFADQRSKIELKERSEIANNIQFAKQKYEYARDLYEASKQELDSDTTVSARLKKKDIIDALIGYFYDQRADSLKEAINLYYEEEHRNKLEEFAREQVRLTEEASEYAQQAATFASQAAASADEATSRVEDAVGRINEAYEKAEEAYEKAEEAYSLAQDAFWESTSREE